jgi:hypothetical protein
MAGSVSEPAFRRKRGPAGRLFVIFVSCLLLLLLLQLLLHRSRLPPRAPCDLIGLGAEVVGHQPQLPRGFKVEARACETETSGGLFLEIVGNHEPALADPKTQ